MEMKKKVLRVNTLLGVIFFLIGVALLVVGGCVNLVGAGILSEKEMVLGMISENTGDDVYVTYRYMGRDYETRLSFYSDLLNEGDAIEVYISPEKPEQADCKMEAYLMGGILMFIGALFAIIGGSFLFIGKWEKIKTGKLMQEGRKVYAEVTGGRVCYNCSVNGRHPFRLECKYEDTATLQTYLYSSGYTWEEPEAYMGAQVAVYIDRNDMKKYYVDLESLPGSGNVNEAEIHDYR